MSTLKTHNLQSPDAGSVNIALAPNAGMVVAGLSTYSNQINVGSNIKLGTAGVVTATSFVGALPISNDTNNRVLTGTGSGGINGEEDLTFDGNQLYIDCNNYAYPLVVNSTQSSVRAVIRQTNDANANSGLAIQKKHSSLHPANHWYGDISFEGWDGSGYHKGGLIECVANGTPANDNMPGELRFSTNAGGTNPTKILTITKDGNLYHTGGGDGRRYSFAGDGTSHYMKFDNTLNGIILNGYGGIAFETYGANERLRITSGGNILVGDGSTYSPGCHVHIHGGTTGLQQLRVQNHTSIGSFSGNYGSEFRHAFSSANHCMLIHAEESNDARRTLDISDANGIFGRFVNGKTGLGRDSNGNVSTRAVLEVAVPFSDVSDNDGSADLGTNGHDALLINISGPGAASGRNVGSIVWGGSRRRAAIMGEYQSSDSDYLALAFFTRGTDGAGDFYKSFIINHNGSAGLHGSLSQNTSDDRLKKDKVEIENALDKVNSLSSFTHKWNEIAVRAGLEENKTEIGLSAQEVQGLYPSLVNVNNTMIDPDNPTTEYLTIHYEKVVPLLVASIKELTSEINSLKSRLSSLEGS